MPVLKNWSLLIAVLALAACGSSEPAGERFDLTLSDKAMSADEIDPVQEQKIEFPGEKPVPDFPPPSDRELMVMSDKLYGGAVEIYDLDAPVDEVNSRVYDPQPLPVVSDSRIMVYPVGGDEGQDYPGQLPMSPDDPVTPEGKVWPNSVLPLKGGERAMLPKPGSTQVFFAHGSASLDAKAHQAIDDYAAQPRDGLTNVEGHASKRAQANDPVEARILNLKESMNRSFEVTKQLLLKGVPPENVRAVAWGDARADESDEDYNRRVDIYAGAQ